MTGLVEQLQADAVNADVPVSTLLRKVKVAAVKLGLDDALVWVERELEGYRSVDDLPDYRKGSGHTVAWNPYQGWQHIHFEGASFADLVSQVYFFEPIANYEAVLASGDGSLKLPLSNELVAMLNESLNVPVPRISNSISRGLIVRIVQRVRDLVLDWSLELARIGITGAGLQFSPDERKKAEGAHISIGSFQGSFNTGDAIGAQSRITLNTQLGERSQLFADIEQAIVSQLPEGPERSAILDANREMQEATQKVGFLAAYNRLLESAANHMTVIGPFLPALGGVIAGF